MIDVTLDEVRSRGWKRVGVLGLGDPIVYTRRLDSLGIACEVLEPERRAEAADLLNPAQVLAEAAVRHALE